jgi:hypothetical protein
MNCKNIVHTTGIGDFIAIDAYLTDTEKIKLEKIYFINEIYKQHNIKNIIERSKKYNHKIKFIELHNHYIDEWDTRRKILHENKINLNNSLIDFEFIWGYSQYKKIKNLKNYFFKSPIANCKKFNLPEKYCGIIPFTNKERQFDKKDWNQVFKILNFLKLKGVVLGQLNKVNFRNNDIINLNQSTSIYEAIEIIKNCSYYLGIDSFLSIIASSHLPSHKIQIKSKIKNCIENFKFYYPCQENINIIRSDINFKYFIRNYYKLL